MVQRAIVIEGTTYKAGDLEAFNNKYAAYARDIVFALGDFSHAPRTIPAALEDPRRFFLTMETVEGEVFFTSEVEAERRTIEGGVTREVGNLPELAERPATGFEELKIAGLIMCIGIVIEARKDGRIQAVSGSHFVTPDSIRENRITASGERLLRAQVEMTRPYGTLTARLMHVDRRHELGGALAGATLQAYEALNLIVPFLLSLGVSQINITNGSAVRFYRLFADGSGTLT